MAVQSCRGGIMTLTEWLLVAQTLTLIVTGGVVFWYTWETAQLRRTARSQLEQQIRQLQAQMEQTETSIRPFVVFLAQRDRDASVVLENVGLGPALNVRLLDAIINPEEEDWKINVHFPDRIPILRPGEQTRVGVLSRVGEHPFGDFFSAHIDPRFATKAVSIVVQYENIQMKSYSVEQVVQPQTLSITGFRALPIPAPTPD
jgi:hypothetical protein